MTDVAPDTLLVVGVYTDSLPHVKAEGRGVHLLGFDSNTGAISDGPIVSGPKNPTYLTISQDGKRLYSLQELDEDVGASIDLYHLDSSERTLTQIQSVPALGSWPCHVGLDREEKRLFVSNYLSGSFVVFPLDKAGALGAEPLKIQRTGSSVNPERQQGPHVHHGVPTPDGRYVLVCDAGTDEIVRHRLEGATINPTPDLVVRATPGSLPRHLVFVPDGSGFLVVHELGATVAAYSYDENAIVRLAEISALPEDWTGAKSGATIRIHPSGKFAYSSNRGHDSLFGVDLTHGLDKISPLGWWSTKGQAPRDFNIDPTGRFLVAANQDGHNLAVFSIDPTTGALTQIGERKNIGSPVCVAFVKT